MDEKAEFWSGLIQYWPTVKHLNETQDVYITTQGSRVRQVFQEFPVLKPLYPFEWERRFDAYEFSTFARDHQSLAWIAVMLYLVCLFGVKWKGTYGQKEKHPVTLNGDHNPNATRKKPTDWLKPILALWNLSLATFSLVGSLRVIPQLISDVYVHGFEFSIIGDGFLIGAQGASGFWHFLFIYSKYLELIDTLFLVLRKRPVIFLHWYHHVTVLLYCWKLYADRPAIGMWFAVMNYVVHAVMYFYYFLTAIGYRPRWSMLVTVLQLTQMAVGVILCAVLGYYLLMDPNSSELTSRTSGALYYGIVIYSSYFALFFWFFLERYLFSQQSLATSNTVGGSKKKHE